MGVARILYQRAVTRPCDVRATVRVSKHHQSSLTEEEEEEEKAGAARSPIRI